VRAARIVALTAVLFARSASAQQLSASSSPPPAASEAPPAPAPASSSPEPSSAPASSSPAPDADDVGPLGPIAGSEGRLRVAVNRPDTVVFVDGVRAGDAPFERDYPPGDHRVRLECDGYKSWEGVVEIRDAMLTPVRALLRPQPSRSSGITVLVIATLFVGGGVTMGVLSSSDRSALDAARNAGRLDNHDPRIDRGEAFAGLADAGFAVAAALATMGTYLVAHDPSPPSIARVGRPRPLHGAAPR
jgi:hypothetical protein